MPPAALRELDVPPSKSGGIGEDNYRPMEGARKTSD